MRPILQKKHITTYNFDKRMFGTVVRHVNTCKETHSDKTERGAEGLRKLIGCQDFCS